MELTGNGANGSFWEMLCEVTKEYGMVNKSEAAAPSAPSIAASAPSEDTVMKDAVEKSVKKPAEVEKKLLGAPSAENRVDGTSPDYKAAMLVLQSEIFLTGLGKNIFKELLRDIRVLGLYVYEKDPVMRQFLLEELLSEKGLRSDTLERCFAMRL